MSVRHVEREKPRTGAGSGKGRGRAGQKVSQLALAWALRDPRMTSLVIGASSVAQLEENVVALENLKFSDEELKEIDVYAVDGGIDLWRGPATS